jgi:acetyl esterase/lipase
MCTSVPVTLNVYPGLPHGFYMFPHLEPSVKYLQSVVAFIDEASQTGKN